MTDLYLILHKVRGEPAFDIAEKLTIGDEEGWLIPTSGHRAYPLYKWPLDDLRDCSGPDGEVPADYINYDAVPPEVLAALPDHYTVSAAKTAKLSGLMQKLGLRKPAPNLAIRGF